MKDVKYYFFAKFCFFTAAGEEDDDGVLFVRTLGGFGGGVFLALLSSFFSPTPLPVEGSFPLKMSSQSGNSLDEGIGASGRGRQKKFASDRDLEVLYQA